jgi:FkbM family methyltransferase
MARLIFDIGMNNGDDTAYYLRKGYQVVAVEADPKLCAAARSRFAHEIDDGRLVVENVGIANHEGELRFWVSNKSVWSSFDSENANKGRSHAKPITVQASRFATLLGRHGVPYFLKIDIEGNDRLCLRDLSEDTRPQFVSIELSHKDGYVDIDLLAWLGYDSFKCVRQNDFYLINLSNLDQQFEIRRQFAKFGPFGQHLRRLGHRRPRDDGWRFGFGSSGVVSSDLTGEWISHEEMSKIWQRLHDIDDELGEKGIGEWYDIHARLGESHDS